MRATKARMRSSAASRASFSSHVNPPPGGGVAGTTTWNVRAPAAIRLATSLASSSLGRVWLATIRIVLIEHLRPAHRGGSNRRPDVHGYDRAWWAVRDTGPPPIDPPRTGRLTESGWDGMIRDVTRRGIHRSSTYRLPRMPRARNPSIRSGSRHRAVR